MKLKERYYIGEMSRLCNISKKTLRYYDKIGLITSYRQDYNNYRYYTYDSLLAVPVLKYYKQMGFKLHEMAALIKGDVPNVYRVLRESFTAKLQEIQVDQEVLRRKYTSTKDWYDLISEAEMVIESDVQDISVKYVEPTMLLYLDQTFENDIKGAIINIDWTNYVETMRNEITGPVIINFSSRSDRLAGKRQPMRILQNTILPCREEKQTPFGGCLMASCYHIGPHEHLVDVYKKIDAWARR